jgi:AraC-like DNA-binding protein
MDFHHIENVTVEDVKRAHMADVAIQDKYGVRYLQFWVNQETGAVFCLIEGPDPETCEKVHQMAHGNIACALTEVETGFYEMMMGAGHTVNDYGLVQKKNGTLDTGYRTILVVSLYGITGATTSCDLSMLLTPNWARKIVREQMERFGGRHLAWDADDSLIAAFDDATNAVYCALDIKKALEQFESKQPDIIFKMGLSASQPVTREGDFFKEAIKLAHRLSLTVQDNQALTCSLVRTICKNEELFANNAIKSLNAKEEEFISNLIHVAELKIADQQFDLNKLSNEVCVSRPQLYRKITALTGRTPNNFIIDLRMQKALSLLKQKKSGIAEIAYNAGFNSPSYFSKCFAEKFGCTPSTFLRKV